MATKPGERIEITERDLYELKRLFELLAKGVSTGNADMLEIHTTFNGQDFVIGYGDAGEPALLSVKEHESLNPDPD